MKKLPEKQTTITGYQCNICHGKKIVEIDGIITHECEGDLISIYEVIDE